METPVKEKNMPTISSNLYGGLQKWVNRASLSIRRTRRNSDVSQTMYRPNMSSEMNGYQDPSQGRIVPSHGRSRSTPVIMPDPESYLDTIGQFRKTSEEAKTMSLGKEALLEPWGRRGSKDDTSRPRKERKNAVEGKPLRRSCSKSESSLIEAARKAEALRSKSRTTPTKSRVRRTSSQDTEGSVESSTSDLDINYNININSRSSQASSKTNIRHRTQTSDYKSDSNGTNKLNEKLRKSSGHNKIARDVKTRLDRWVDKTAGFQDARQSSFESTSSSDDLSDIVVLKRDKNQAISKETREMRDLQNALDELVSSCGRSSRKSSDDEPLVRDSIEATNTRANRKISLKDTGSVFSRAVDTGDHCSQSVLQNEYRLKKCGSSSGSAGSGSSSMGLYVQEKQTNSELEESYDSVDGKSAEIEGSKMVEDYEAKDSVKCDSDIGHGSEEILTRVSTTPENLESEINIQNNRAPSLESVNQIEGEDECQQENQQSKYNDEDNTSLLNKTKQTENSEQLGIPNRSAGEMKDGLETESQMTLPRSMKNYHAPPPPNTKDSQEKKDKMPGVKFNDLALDEFAEECLRQADKKKKKTKERESKSDSEDEKRSLKIDFVYVKRDADERSLAQSYPGQKVHMKAATHPKTAYDEHHLTYITLSDNELERNEIPSNARIREKRNSADSLDGRVLFNLTAPYNTVLKNEDELSSDGLATEEEQATESTRPGMRKFPSMPLFYVPKEFDQSGEFKRNKSPSIGKSLWKRIKSLPRHSVESQRNSRSKRKEEDTSSAPAQIVDPFYHGEKEDQDVQAPSFRAKAWTLSGAKINRPASSRRPSLQTRQSAPAMKVESTEEQPCKLLNEYVVIPPRNGDESQC